MKRAHLALVATALLLCTFATNFLPQSWLDTSSGVFIERADAQGGFSKEQLRILKGKQNMKQKKMEKRMMKKKMKWKMKQKMKRKWKTPD